MLFASSKDALRRSLVGVAVEIQGTDYSEVAHESGAFLASSHSQLYAYRFTVLVKVQRGTR
jgi:hypothetical protein